MRIERFGPVIDPSTHPEAGTNINGPSLIRVPEWADRSLGEYRLYFADHKGNHIRVAHADAVTGPYAMHEPGCLHVHESRFATEVPQGIEPTSAIQAAAIEAEGYDAHFTPHVASPDVIVDHDRRRIWMAFHGLADDGSQWSRIVWSSDGLAFEVHEPVVALPYLRIVPEPVDGRWLAMSMPGVPYRSPDLVEWEWGPMLFGEDFRHAALLRRHDLLHVFWTRVGDAPEHILHSTVMLDADWTRWAPSEPESVLVPEEPWEGADLAVEPSVRGQAATRVRQLRDPALFEDEGRLWLLYAYAGEAGVAIAEIHDL